MNPAADFGSDDCRPLACFIARSALPVARYSATRSRAMPGSVGTSLWARTSTSMARSGCFRLTWTLANLCRGAGDFGSAATSRVYVSSAWLGSPAANCARPSASRIRGSWPSAAEASCAAASAARASRLRRWKLIRASRGAAASGWAATACCRTAAISDDGARVRTRISARPTSAAALFGSFASTASKRVRASAALPCCRSSCTRPATAGM